MTNTHSLSTCRLDNDDAVYSHHYFPSLLFSSLHLTLPGVRRSRYVSTKRTSGGSRDCPKHSMSKIPCRCLPSILWLNRKINAAHVFIDKWMPWLFSLIRDVSCRAVRNKAKISEERQRRREMYLPITLVHHHHEPASSPAIWLSIEIE